MIAASAPRPDPSRERLLVVEPRRGRLVDAVMAQFPSLLDAGDAVIVNDAATLPASLRLLDGRELRLVGHVQGAVFRAVLFGAGDHRTPTERRPEPSPARVHDVLECRAALSADVIEVDATSSRLLTVRFDANEDELHARLYRAGVPVQYAHVPHALELWAVQTRFAARPWAFEMPSAGRPITFAALDALRKRGVLVAPVTHAAGVSSTGSEALDRRLPFSERFAISEAAVSAVSAARAAGKRVVAVGTTVVRALESAFLQRDGLTPGEGEATLVIGPGFRSRVVDAVLTGMHPQGTSHFALLEAFAPRRVLMAALNHADQKGYLEHEFGDSMLVLPDVEGSQRE